MTLNFFIRFSTKFGQSLFVTGDLDGLGNDDLSSAVPLQYFNDELWRVKLTVSEKDAGRKSLQYRYILREADGSMVVEWGNDRIVTLNKINAGEIVLYDEWNHAGQVENAFFTKPFQDVLLKSQAGTRKPKIVKQYSHQFKVKAPLLGANEVLCIAGSSPLLGEWDTKEPMLLQLQGNWWSIRLNLFSESFPIAYKYGVYNTREKVFRLFESGKNRMLNSESGKATLTIIHDGFARLGSPAWKGAGVAIPVFSLRSPGGFGTGEFTDIRLLVDWAKATGLRLIQLLPINDTTATHSFLDSYPYAAISAFALHPLYLNLWKLAGTSSRQVLEQLQTKRDELNSLPVVDYEEVMRVKYSVIKELFHEQREAVLNDPKYFEFFEMNRHWLVPYAAFCYLRDKFKTADYNQWKQYSDFDEAAIQRLVSPGQKHYDGIAIHYFIQYHLHLQLREATDYAHRNGIVVKGDLPIGIYRYGADAWTAPALYDMDAQAGAPPDDFAVKGQNWGFPTYNWKKMQEDGFAWWRRRFEQMSEYFDAFRIDHILGFFRIWSIPLHAVEGIMGRFVPAIPVHISELHQLATAFSAQRFCRPYLPEDVVNARFGADAAFVKEQYLFWNDGSFQLKPDVDTQRKVERHFAGLPDSGTNRGIKAGLCDMISNVIFFEDESAPAEKFHFRINMDQTASYRYLDDQSKYRLRQLYINYFFQRQDEFWKKEAMNKLPELKRSTNMLVCGEDLGMVPGCVPDVMSALGILSLEIQRMPKDPGREFFHPADAPYLSVVTPSTHDMSTIRGWWEEDPSKTQRFYNNILGHYGAAPFFCDARINKEIVIQHLYSPAMWSIFQLQDLLGSDDALRRNDPHDERINIPADPRHYWRYRMHLTLEELMEKEDFNRELSGYVTASGR